MEKLWVCEDLENNFQKDKSDENSQKLAECYLSNSDEIVSQWELPKDQNNVISETRQEVNTLNQEVCLKPEVPDYEKWIDEKLFSQLEQNQNNPQVPYKIIEKPKEEKFVQMPPLLNFQPQVEINTSNNNQVSPISNLRQEEQNINLDTRISDISKDFENKKETPELISETITNYEVKSWDKLWTVIKNHYNLNSNIEIYKKLIEIIDYQTDQKLKNKLIKSKWWLIHPWDLIILK